VVLVADRGMAGEENLRYLQRGGGHYIIGERMRAGIGAVEAALSRPGRYRVVRDNLEVKEVTVGDGEARLRYVICRNPVEAERDREQRERLITDLHAELKLLDQTRGDHAQRACALRISRRFGGYLKQSSTGRLSVNTAALHEEERLDGKYLLRSSDDTLSAEDIALGYRQLLEVERGWRDLKQHLELRPVYHRREDRITAHVLLCFLGLLLVRVAERAAAQSWPRLRRELQRVVLVDLSGPAGTVSQRTELTPVQAGLLRRWRYRPQFGSGPPRVQRLPPLRSHTPPPAVALRPVSARTRPRVPSRQRHCRTRVEGLGGMSPPGRRAAGTGSLLGKLAPTGGRASRRPSAHPFSRCPSS
jgi:hypothetical protein